MQKRCNEMEFDENPTLADYLKQDYNLSILMTLIEGFNAGKEKFFLSDFVKGDWNEEFMDIDEELYGAESALNFPGKVHNQIFMMSRDLNLLEVKKYGYDNIRRMAYTAVESYGTDEPELLGAILDDVCQIKMRHQNMLNAAKGKELTRDMFDQLLEKPHDVHDPEKYYLNLEDDSSGRVTTVVPEHNLYILCPKRGAIVSIEKQLNEYAEELVARTNKQEGDVPFRNQLKTFEESLAECEQANGKYLVPSSFLSKRGFHLVSMLFVLNLKSAIQVESWSLSDGWYFELRRNASSLDDALRSVGMRQSAKEATVYVSYDAERHMLKVGSNEVSFLRRRKQRFLLEVLFSSPEKPWSMDEIEEQWDSGTGYEKNYARKFYDAARQINNTIKQYAPNQGSLLDCTMTEIQINPTFLP